MKVVNVSDESHAAAKQAAERAGMSLSAWASRALESGAVPDAGPPEHPHPDSDPPWYAFFTNDHAERLSRMALERSQTASETLSAALDALARPRDWRAETPLPASHEALASEYKTTIPLVCHDEMVGGFDEEKLEGLLREMLARVPLSPGIQPPKPRPEPDCRCDGPEAPGPHHKKGCGRRT